MLPKYILFTHLISLSYSSNVPLLSKNKIIDNPSFNFIVFWLRSIFILNKSNIKLVVNAVIRRKNYSNSLNISKCLFSISFIDIQYFQESSTSQILFAKLTIIYFMYLLLSFQYSVLQFLKIIVFIFRSLFILKKLCINVA